MCRLTSSKPARGTAGFTLIEVVVTLAVIAAILVSIGSLVGVAVRGTHALDDHLVLVETARAIEAGLPDRNSLTVGTHVRRTGRPALACRRATVSRRNSTRRRQTPWVPLTASITVQTPDGTSLTVTTVRLGRRPSG